jgi:hypothetical protein
MVDPSGFTSGLQPAGDATFVCLHPCARRLAWCLLLDVDELVRLGDAIETEVYARQDSLSRRRDRLQAVARADERGMVAAATDAARILEGRSLPPRLRYCGARVGKTIHISA